MRQAEEKKQLEQKRIHTDRVKNLLKKRDKQNMSNKKEGSRQGSGSKKRDNSKGKNVVNMFGKSPLLQRTSFKERTRLELLDWKESFCYKQMLVRNNDDSETFDDPLMFKDDEIDTIQKQIRSFRVQKDMVKADELLDQVPRFTKRAYHTLEYIYKEILSEQYYKLEYD